MRQVGHSGRVAGMWAELEANRNAGYSSEQKGKKKSSILAETVANR